MDQNDFVQAVDVDDPDLPLDSADPEYIRGIEVGMMLQASIMGFPIHLRTNSVNALMIMRIADCFDMEFSAEETDDSDIVIVSLIPPGDDYFEDDEDND